MKFYLIFFLLIAHLISTPLSAQLPIASDTAIKIVQVMQVKPNAVRIIKNNIDQSFYYGTFSGNIYKIIQSGNTYYDTLIATSAKHNINYLQGMAFRDSILYLAGNRKTTNAAGYGLVIRGKFTPPGSWAWDTLLRTAAYQSSATLFDHAFSSICFTPNGDSIYIASGSRTDHGEIQTSNNLYPNTREVPLTSLILRIPVKTAAPIILANDSTLLSAGPYIYCRGVRNTFDMALAPNGDLLGSENSGDRDDPEELNWLRSGAHYGFPWRMGGNVTPMQFPGYVPGNDKLINHQSLSWTNGYFYNDLSYPLVPVGITFTEPIKNYGPDADKFRDTFSGSARDASDEGTYITSFTPHRSPLGLVFDTQGKLAPPYNSSGFLLSYTEGTGDSTGTLANNSTGPFSDLSQDLLQLALFKDTISNQYSMNCFKIVGNFKNPVDALLDANVIYILESHGANNPVPAKIYALTFPVNTKTGSSTFLPKDTVICNGTAITIAANVKGQFLYKWSNGATTSAITVSPLVNTSYILTINNGIITSIDTVLVSVNPNPMLPGSITGPAKPCPGDSAVEYSVAAVSGISIYHWSIPIGATIASGQGTRIIKVNFAASFINGVISVVQGNQCGLSMARSKSVSRNVPGSTSSITGLVNGLCGGLTTNYSINALSTATAYLWTVPAGVLINSGQGTTAINVSFPFNFVSGAITVRAGNFCGYGVQRSLTVRAIPALPGNITGSLTVCANQQGVQYAISSVSSSSSYGWTVPAGAAITSGQGTTSVLVNFGITAGNVRVRSVNLCGNSNYKSLAVGMVCREPELSFNNIGTIYSHPGNQQFTLYINTNEPFSRLKLFSVKGQLLKEWTISSRSPFEFGENFAKGIYIAELISGERKKVFKLIK